MISPVQSPMVLSKFFVLPRFFLLISNRTGNGAPRAKLFMISTLSSVELSSQMTSSSGSLFCAAILSSWSDKKRPPLYEHIATEIRRLFIRSLLHHSHRPIPRIKQPAPCTCRLPRKIRPYMKFCASSRSSGESTRNQATSTKPRIVRSRNTLFNMSP